MPRSLIGRIVSSAWFAYFLVLALQLKGVWGIWEYKDMAIGDTTSYLGIAKLWATQGVGSIAWSPLYTLFYSLFLHFTQDLYFATLAHRLVIVFILPLLILTLMRRLLHPWVAWGMAAWWTAMPINFNSLYEVHLFALIPILLAYLAADIRGPWGRGICCGTLLTAAVLMRNEITIPFLIFASACAIYEYRARRAAMKPAAAVPLAPYAVPILFAVALSAAFYSRATEKGANLQANLDLKHTLNVCQVYAFGYQQRHPEWTKSPWTECQGLMQTTFGAPQPSLRDAFFRNRKAIIEHVLWNISLTPSGLQVLMLNAMSGTVNPDYAFVLSLPIYALPASLLLVGVLLAGAIKARRRWSTFYPERIRPHAWTFIAMLCVAAVTPLVIATQRPRPSYLFSLSILFLSCIGLSLELIFGAEFLKRFNWAWPVIAISLVLGFPRFFPPLQRDDYQPLLGMYRNLTPFQEKLGPGVVVVTPGYGTELCNYFAPPGKGVCNGVFYYGLGTMRDGATVQEALAANKARLFYADAAMLNEPPVVDFVAHASAWGWQPIGQNGPSGKRWLLLEQQPR